MGNTIKFDKAYDGVLAWKLNAKGAAECVDIKEIYEHDRKGAKRYRVDYKGRTVASLVSLTEAKAKARKLLANI